MECEEEMKNSEMVKVKERRLKFLRKRRLSLNKSWKDRKFHVRPEVKPIVKRCVDCSNKVLKHHLRCNACWIKYQATKIK
jgi:hypothetical protein